MAYKLCLKKDVKNKKDKQSCGQELYKTKIAISEYRLQSGSEEISRIQIKAVRNYLQTEWKYNILLKDVRC